MEQPNRILAWRRGWGYGDGGLGGRSQTAGSDAEDEAVGAPARGGAAAEDEDENENDEDEDESAWMVQSFKDVSQGDRLRIIADLDAFKRLVGETRRR